MRTSSSKDKKQISVLKAEAIARENGYDGLHFCPPFCAKTKYRKGSVVFKIPFINESFTAAVVRLVECSSLPVSVICEHPRTLKDILTSNRLYDQCSDLEGCTLCPSNWPGSCMKRGGVYEISCVSGDKYVGETGRPLATRIIEHMKALNNPSLKSYVDAPLARHRVAAYPNQSVPQIRIKFLDFSADTVKPKVLEAIWIKRKRPELNVKEEMEEALSLLH